MLGVRDSIHGSRIRAEAWKISDPKVIAKPEGIRHNALP
jgi:hypothetical protein